jgi:hypothetical protein
MLLARGQSKPKADRRWPGQPQYGIATREPPQPALLQLLNRRAMKPEFWQSNQAVASRPKAQRKQTCEDIIGSGSTLRHKHLLLGS